MTKNVENMTLKQYEFEHLKRDFLMGVTSLFALTPLPPMSHFVTVLANPPPP